MEVNNNNPSLFQMAKPDPALNFWLNQWTPKLFIDQTYFIELDQGRIHGSIVDGDVLFFEGIPYALPPMGFEGRWRPPRKINSFAELNRADNYQQKKSCPQYYWDMVESHSTEDCLFLDITR